MFRTTALAGRRLDELAAAIGATVPRDLKRDKGWIGTLLEAALGASASSRPVPDFEALGIELKTLPLGADGRVRESTFVTSAPLDGSMAHTWEASRVREKLAAVLWVPIVGDGPPGERLIGQGVLWRPDPDEEAVLRADWEELSAMLALGEHGEVDARRGVALQLRPKAATSSSLTWTLGEEGDWVQAGPVGFYLRATFTRALLERRLRLAT
ncbi:MAG: DNA mismatch repair endonuclease MutH [Myxococcales bacterium]|nr:DNA mismatch repair endonuclease MutH [Myxococcales bacterium]